MSVGTNYLEKLGNVVPHSLDKLVSIIINKYYLVGSSKLSRQCGTTLPKFFWLFAPADILATTKFYLVFSTSFLKKIGKS